MCHSIYLPSMDILLFSYSGRQSLVTKADQTAGSKAAGIY